VSRAATIVGFVAISATNPTHVTSAAVALQLTLAGWALFELGLRVRERLGGRGGAARDRGTRALIAITIATAIVLAVVTRSRSTGPRIAGAERSLGVIVMWLGLAIRVWAIAALGRAFRTTVEVDSGQAVVSTGPYRWVRHPSYSGLLLIMTGCGLAAGNWLALAACALLPVPALLWRIHVEEAELTRVLGDRYRAYQAQTKHLIPGVW
jgi:protein-S-isoprenylcysteine O-methyltransferase Ste14